MTNDETPTSDPNDGGEFNAVPSAPPSSLSPAAVERKTALESISPYLPSGERNPDYSDGVQSELRDLYRGEETGAPGHVRPAADPDLDLPLHVNGYDFSSVPGIGAEDRDVIDRFLPAALESGLGQAKVYDAIAYAMTTTNPTPQDFAAKARSGGWSEAHIKAAIDFYNSERTRPATSPRAAAPAVPAVPTTAAGRAARMREIESLMYIDSKANPAYFGGELEHEYRRLINGA